MTERTLTDRDPSVTSGGAREAGLRDGLTLLLAGAHPDPFALLGPHRTDTGFEIRTFQPGASRVCLLRRDSRQTVIDAQPSGEGGLFVAKLPPEQVAPGRSLPALVAPPGRPGGGAARPGPADYLLEITWPSGFVQLTEDPYAFDMLLGELDLHLINEGRHHELPYALGAREMRIDGVVGVRFAVWAPNAQRVSVVGDFNDWNGLRHPMRRRVPSGVWELFVPRLAAGQRYKFEVRDAHGYVGPQRADPLAMATERPPATASIVDDPRPFLWHDEAWLARRARRDPGQAPMSIYEVHALSWLADAGDSWDRLGERLIPYVQALGFTHIELLPIMEHPFRGSWGYQPLSQFAPTARLGSPRDFARFVDRCHAADIGVILDWVPAHFPGDAHGLAHFDGSALYEYADPREGFHRDWNTLIYNLGRHEVRGFMIASALHWIEHFHVDGLRVDAVASMLYRDYSRGPGQWLPNVHGGRENLEAIAFLRELNDEIHVLHPGVVTIAEESTAWPGVTTPTREGGLGFDFKWNMGWMHDTLGYMGHDPVHRRWHHHDMTFAMVYAYSERFILPLSHDEVVYGKGSLYGRMPGDTWSKLAQLRAYLSFMWTHPGRKLLFMGGELGQPTEWNHDAEVDWSQLDQPGHAGLALLVRDLNRLYRERPALHRSDDRPEGFHWIVGDDRDQSVFAWLRLAEANDPRPVLCISNLTPVPRFGYRVGVPVGGHWRELLNSDSRLYGGSDLGNDGSREAEPIAAHGEPMSLALTLPPLSTLVLGPAAGAL